MLASDVGVILTYMLKRRQARVGDGRRPFFPGEKAVAQLLNDADATDWQDLCAIFETFGFSLQVAEGGPGRPEVGKCTFLLLRDPSLPTPEFGGSSPVIEAMKKNKSELPKITRAWWIYIWAQHMALLYTDRALSEVSAFVGRDFSQGNLILATSEGLNEIGKMDIPDKKRKLFAEILLSGDPVKEIPRRVTSFLDGMVGAGLLEQIGNEKYRQTFLAAKEAEQCVENGFSELLDAPIQDPNDGVPNLAISGDIESFSEEIEA